MSTKQKLLQAATEPLTGAPGDYNSLIERVGDARFVLLGEATHGTHEFYRERAQITKRLIRERGFNAVAVEADWPDAHRVNRFAGGAKDDTEAVEALAGFKRFPQWMWRNADVLDFAGWLRAHNDSRKFHQRKAGFYGLDLYSLRASIEAVLSYLTRVDPSSVPRARKRYACFDHFGPDSRSYGLATGLGMEPSCEDAVVSELTELRLREDEYMSRDGRVAADDLFSAEQNAVVVKNAEQYYRTMFRGEVSSWNLRDHHMMDTLVSLVAHLEQFEKPAKVVVWAHNSHLGDARATEMRRRGELNLGQLVRERFGRQAVLIGFTTPHGTVTAASDWDAPAERKRLRPALPESHEALFHETGLARFWLDLEKNGELRAALGEGRLERAVGVVYRPETERASHYFKATLPEHFDAVLHIDETRAVEPLERTAGWETGEVEETYPSGL